MGRWDISRSLGFFSCQTPCRLWNSHQPTCWEETLQHLAGGGSCFCSWAGDMPPAGDALCWHGLCSKQPKLQVMRALWGCVCGGPPSLPPVGHQLNLTLCPHAGVTASRCCRVRKGVWQGTGSRAGREGKAVGKGEQKEIHWQKAERDIVLFLFLTTGSCEFLRKIILGLRPGCFMLHRCLSFPSSFLNPADIICNYLKKAEAQGECPWWMAVISVLWLPKSYYSSAISGCLPVGRIPSRINCISHLIDTPGSMNQACTGCIALQEITTCLLMCTIEGQCKQEAWHATDIQIFACSQKLVMNGGKEKITPVLGSFLFLVWRKCGLLLQSVTHSDVQKLLPLCFST